MRGAVNVAGEGTISLERVLRRLGRRSLPVVAPAFGPLAGISARLGGPKLSEDVVAYIRYGRGIDTRRMRDELGFAPRYTTLEAIEAVAA
jgi:UDP-glucose 4-epimerase